MKINLMGLLRDVSLTTLAFAIALGWSLYQFAYGMATFVEGVTVHSRGFDQQLGGFASLPQYGESLTWVWGHHLFTFGQLVMGLIELGTVLLVTMLVRRFSSRPVVPTD
jgi:hypothetical protein